MKVAMVSARTPSCSSAALPLVRLQHRQHGVHDQTDAVRFWGLTNVRMFVTPIVATISARLGEASQCAVSLTFVRTPPCAAIPQTALPLRVAGP